MDKLKKTEDESKSRAERIKQLEEELRQVRINEVIEYILMYANPLLMVHCTGHALYLITAKVYCIFDVCSSVPNDCNLLTSFISKLSLMYTS